MNSPSLTRRQLLHTGVAAGAGLGVMTMSGCGSATPAEARDELRVGVQTLPSTLDANASVSNAGIQTYHNIYDTLIARDTTSATANFVPGLAESWEQVSDLEWEFVLREGVKFHDGSDLSAEDVAYSMNRVIELEDPSYATARSYLLANFTGFEATDTLVVRATTTKPEPLIEHMLSDPNSGISSKAYTEEVGLDAATSAPVATGPYKVAEFLPGESLTLERVEGHWSGTAPYAKITYLLIPEIASRITALTNDEVDFITNIPPDQESLITGNNQLTLSGEVLELYHLYRLNMSNPAMKDSRLRAALDWAIDRQAIVDSIWSGKAEVATSYQFNTYDDELKFGDRVDIGFDPERARALVAESDYAGEVIEIYNTTDYYTYADLVGQAVVDMWADVGITGKLVQVDDIPDEDIEELEIRTWSNPLYYPDPMGMIERHWAPEGEAANVGHFVPTDAYSEAFEVARYSQEATERRDALSSVFDFYREETPFIYLFKPYEAIAMRSDIEYTQPPALRPYCLTFRDGDISETTA